MGERELVEKFRDAKGRLKELKLLAAEAQQELDTTENEILELLESDEKDATAIYEGIGCVKSQKPKLYASTLAENRDELAEWLTTIGRRDMVVSYVFPKTLSGFVKERVESGEEIPDCIQYYLKPSLKYYG